MSFLTGNKKWRDTVLELLANKDHDYSKRKLIERYVSTLEAIEHALHITITEVDETLAYKKEFFACFFRQLAVNLEKISVGIDYFTTQPEPEIIFEHLTHGKLELKSLTKQESLRVVAAKLMKNSLYGLPGILEVVDLHRTAKIFKLLRQKFAQNSDWPVKSRSKQPSSIVNVVTSIFGDAVLRKQINAHPCTLHIYRTFIATAASTKTFSTTESVNALVSTIASEIFFLKFQGSTGKHDRITAVSISSQSSISFDESAPFLFLDRFVSLEKVTEFTKSVLFSPDAKYGEETELVLNGFMSNEHAGSDLSDLPYLLPTYIHYSWALVKSSDSIQTTAGTVIHGGQPPYAMLFASVFDDLSALGAYMKLFGSSTFNSLILPNTIEYWRGYFETRLVRMANIQTINNVFQVALSILSLGSTILALESPGFKGTSKDLRKALQRDISTIFSSEVAALRALTLYGLSIGQCGLQSVGASETNEIEKDLYVKMSEDFGERAWSFFGTNRIHFRTVPAADSAVLANLLITTSESIMIDADNIKSPIFPFVLSGIGFYSLLYWMTASSASILSRCPILLKTIEGLRNNFKVDAPGDVKGNNVRISRVMAAYSHHQPKLRKRSAFSFSNSASSIRYLQSAIKLNLHKELAEIVHEALQTTHPSTPKASGAPVDTRVQANNDSWLATGARIAKLAAVREFWRPQILFEIDKKHLHSKSACHPVLQHHLSHCDGCAMFTERILPLMEFLNPKTKVPECFKPILAVSGHSALRCSFSLDTIFTTAPVLITQFWLPAYEDSDLVAAPMDAVADIMANHLSSLCLHGTPVQLLSFRFVVLNSLSTFEEEDLSCFEIPPVDVALPVAFKDICGCVSEIYRWWSTSPRHRVYLRGLVDLSEPKISKKRTISQPSLVEFLVDIRPCFSSTAATSFRPFDRICHIFGSESDFLHFKKSMVNLAAVNDLKVMGLGPDGSENAISMASFFNFPFLPFSLRQIDIDIHSRYAVAMMSSNWFDALLLANWHAILIPVSNDTCDCAFVNVESTFRRKESMASLMQIPHFLKGLTALSLFCRDSMMMTLSYGPSTWRVEKKKKNEHFNNNFNRRKDGEDFEMQILYLIRWLQTAYHEAFPIGGDNVTAFAKEPTGYSPIVWTTALQFVEHAAALVNFDSISTYKDLNDNFSEAAHYLSKTAALLLGQCDTISYYHLFAFANDNQMTRKVSMTCTGNPDNVEAISTPRVVFRQDLVSLVRAPVYE